MTWQAYGSAWNRRRQGRLAGSEEVPDTCAGQPSQHMAARSGYFGGLVTFVELQDRATEDWRLRYRRWGQILFGFYGKSLR